MAFEGVHCAMLPTCTDESTLLKTKDNRTCEFCVSMDTGICYDFAVTPNSEQMSENFIKLMASY